MSRKVPVGLKASGDVLLHLTHEDGRDLVVASVREQKHRGTLEVAGDPVFLTWERAEGGKPWCLSLGTSQIALGYLLARGGKGT